MVIDFSKNQSETVEDEDDLEILFLKLRVLELRFEEVLVKELIKKVVI